jgi:hypothetical protein
MQAKANVSVAQAQYDLMLAGYRDEEIAQAAAAVKQAQAAYDTRRTFTPVRQGCGKAAPFPPTIWKMRVPPATRRRHAEIRAG